MRPITLIELKPIKESTRDYEDVEKAIKRLFKEEVYYPILREIYPGRSVLRNSAPSATFDYPEVLSAIGTGRITFFRGTFSGRLNSRISKELRALGARFDRRTRTYKIEQSSLPIELQFAISASESKFKQKLLTIDRKLAEIVPEQLAKKLSVEKFFDRAIYKVEKQFQKSVRGITVAPKLSDHDRKRLAREWGENLQLWIRDFTDKEVKELRVEMANSVLKGNRYGAAVKAIQDSYGVTTAKAKFLARQETSLAMTKLKQIRYQNAGVDYYRWCCVAGTAKHPVRPMHKQNDGKVFRWDAPPIVDAQGNRKNPGQDYNCRCFARPLVGYKPG